MPEGDVVTVTCPLELLVPRVAWPAAVVVPLSFLADVGLAFLPVVE